MIRPARLAALLALAAPAAAQTPFAAPVEPIVVGQAYDLPSRALGGSRRVNVMLPPGYAEPGNRGRRYPVLYLLDEGGGRHFETVAALVRDGALARSTQPAILVAVDGAAGRDVAGAERAEALRRFLVDELKPRVLAAYRSDGTDALLGAGEAGRFVVDTAMRRGADFSRFVAIGPALDGGPGRDVDRLLSSANIAPRTLWITSGSEGAAAQRSLDRLVAALRARTPGGMTWTYAPMPGETRATIMPAATLRLLRMLFPAAR